MKAKIIDFIANTLIFALVCVCLGVLAKLAYLLIRFGWRLL